MKHTTLFAAGAVALGLAAATYVMLPGTDASASTRPSPAEKGSPIVEVAVPTGLSPDAQLGKRAFDAVCAACHGENGAGREGMGPPFVHPFYKPGHHGDMAFVMAVKQGVQAHHWTFGNMPPQAGLTGGDVKNIIAYVRELQRFNGIE